MNVAELKQQLRALVELPEDTPLCSAKAYAAILPAKTACTAAIAEIWESASEGQERETIRELSVAGRREVCKRQRLPGWTGSYDTPPETWTAIREAADSGETLRSLSDRFQVIYSALIWRRDKDCRYGKAWGVQRERRPSNVIRFPKRARG